jgi:hypothetical protein
MPDIVLPKFTLTRVGSPGVDLSFTGEKIGELDAARINFPPDANTKLDLRKEPVTFSLAVKDANDFKPNSTALSDPSPLDEAKLEDVYLYLTYTVAVPAQSRA